MSVRVVRELSKLAGPDFVPCAPRPADHGGGPGASSPARGTDPGLPRFSLAPRVLWAPVTMKRLLSIGFIWGMCAVAWMILGSTIQVRTGGSSGELTSEVHRLWGPPLRLAPPTAHWTQTRNVEETVVHYAPNGTPVSNVISRPQQVPVWLGLVGTDAEVDLALEQRQKGLLWFPTYALGFRASYVFENTDAEPREVTLSFAIPADNVGIDGFEVTDAEGAPVKYEISGGAAEWKARFGPGEQKRFALALRTRGTSSWHYALAQGGEVKDFKLRLTTDFEEVDFPPGTVSPTRHSRAEGRWSGDWEFRSLISSASIGLTLPQRLNPGEVASRITFFAPVGLLFFFFVVSILALAQSKNLHPLQYFFLSCAFFAFHLLFAYLVDHLPLAPSFLLSSLVSTVLVVTYARWFVGWKFSLREMGISQLLYLVLFSFSFFWNGFTGLSVTVGAILTLFAMMQVTGKLDWSKLAQPQSPPPAPPSGPVGHGTPVARDLSGVVEAFAMPPRPEARG